MNNALFEGLLYEEEGPALDFKKEQYRFVKASEEDKSELLKDILGFANGWRRADAYILTGVEDVRGARKRVVGIAAGDHLDDHSLQQFVNNLTNQPVRFHYQAFEFEGRQVGIISIEEQARPIYLKRDYGKLLKEKVYVRRGSSTDPTKPASLEEIAQMRVGTGQDAAELLVGFADIDRDDPRGTTICWDAEFCEMPKLKEIPDLAPPGERNPFGIDLSGPLDRANSDYFRERANFEFVHRLFQPVRLMVENTGRIEAANVRIELTVSKNIGVMALDELPDPPKERADLVNSAVFKSIRPAFRRNPGEVSIDENDERFRIEIDCGHLQPGRRVWSDVFYIGKGASGSVSLAGVAFADKLPQPKAFELTVSAEVRRTKMSVAELCALRELPRR
jgi:hypothetical protein